MNNKLKLWILLAISNSTNKNGLEIGDLYNWTRPNEIQFTGSEQLFGYLEELEKESCIEKTPGTLFYKLTSKGKKELGNVPYSDYFDVVKFFPNLELRVRIKNLENLVFGAALAFLSLSFIGKNQQSSIITVILLSLFLVGFAMAILNFMNVAAIALERVQISFLNVVLNFIETNKGWLGYGLIVLITISGIGFAKVRLHIQTPEIVFAVIVEIIAFMILNSRRINTRFKILMMGLKRPEQ